MSGAEQPKKLTSIFRIVEIQKSLFKILAGWPKRKPSFAYKFQHGFIWLINLSFQYFLFAEMHKNFFFSEYKALTDLLSSMVSEIAYQIKHFLFDLNRKGFMDLMDKLKDPFFNEYPKECDIYVKKTSKYVRMIIRSYLFIVCNLLMMYFLRPFVDGGMSIRFSVFDLGRWKYVFHCYQVFCIAIACINNTSIDLFALGLMSVGSTQFQILSHKITNARKWAGLSNEEIDNGLSNFDLKMSADLDEKIYQYLTECANHHIKLLEFADSVDKVFSYCFLVQFADSVLAICNTWFQFMLEDNLSRLIFLTIYTITLLMQLALYCIYGNALMLRSEEIRSACYNSEWFNSGTSVRKTLILIMERSKRSTVLTAGKFSKVNLQTYAGLVRMSYSYFALMNRLYGND